MTQFAEIDGARIAFDVTGAGPDLVLLHAGVTDRHMWDDVVPDLSSDRRIVRYDMRGFGETVEEAQVEWAPRRDLLGVMDAAGVDAATVVGVSMGGGAAINAVLDHPDRFSALVAVNPGVGGFDYRADDWENQIEARIDDAMEAKRWDELATLEMEMWLAGPHRSLDDMDAEAIARMRSWLLVSYEKPPPWSRAMPMDPPANERLGEISIPTLAVLGALDVASVHGVVDRIADAVPNASKAVMNTAHLPPLEDPQGFVRALRDFLD